MRVLLDTHAFAWAFVDRSRLSERALGVMAHDDNDVHVSVASIWEIAIKVGGGKWSEAEALLMGIEQHLDDAGFQLLQIEIKHVRLAGLMPGVHRDPFDRLLAAQARTEDLTLVSSDQKLRQLGASCLW